MEIENMTDEQERSFEKYDGDRVTTYAEFIGEIREVAKSDVRDNPEAYRQVSRSEAIARLHRKIDEYLEEREAAGFEFDQLPFDPFPTETMHVELRPVPADQFRPEYTVRFDHVDGWHNVAVMVTGAIECEECGGLHSFPDILVHPEASASDVLFELFEQGMETAPAETMEKFGELLDRLDDEEPDPSEMN